MTEKTERQLRQQANPNLVINGELLVWSFGTSISAATSPNNNDDSEVVDGHYLLSDGNDVVDVIRDVDNKPLQSYSAVRLVVQTANKRFGWLTILDEEESAKVAGTPASFSLFAQGSGLANLRVGIVEWTGSADNPTTDVVSAWSS